MSTLALQQQALLGTLLALPGSAQAADALTALKAQVLMPWARGLNAYQANGHDLAERSLLAAYPVVAALMGDDSFATLARELWHRHPPVRGDLACWGDALATFVAPNPQLADVPYLADVARLEWALHRAAGAPDASADPASFALLTRADPDSFTLRLAPGTMVIASDWPVASLVTAHLHDDPPLKVAAARVQARFAECAVVWRQGQRPRVVGCTPAEAALLQTLLRGHSLLESLNDALAVNAGFDLGPWLPGAVKDGLVLGTEVLAKAPSMPDEGPLNQPPDGIALPPESWVLHRNRFCR